MSIADIVIICILAAAVAAATVFIVRRRKKRQVYRLLRQLCRLRRIVKQQKR